DMIVPVDLRREVDDDETARAPVAALAQPGKDAAVTVIGDQPLETGAVTIELVQGGQVAVKMIEVADQCLDAGVSPFVYKMPVERIVVCPFAFLAEFVAHEEKLLARMSKHEAVVGAQIRKSLPLISRHAAEDRALAMHDFVM